MTDLAPLTPEQRSNAHRSYLILQDLERGVAPVDDLAAEEDRKNFEAEYAWDHQNGRQFGQPR